MNDVSVKEFILSAIKEGIEEAPYYFSALQILTYNTSNRLVGIKCEIPSTINLSNNERRWGVQHVGKGEAKETHRVRMDMVKRLC